MGGTLPIGLELRVRASGILRDGDTQCRIGRRLSWEPNWVLRKSNKYP